MFLRTTLLNSWQHKNSLTFLLLPFAGVYGIVMLLRDKLYKSNFFKSYRAPIPVVVVGNITVGGTGKTPLVIHLVELLKKQGYNPGVISRGYTSKATNFPLTVTAETAVSLSGDEPLLIARRTNAPMVIGPDRKAAIEQLIKEFDVDVIVSDDGLQHMAMQRDIELCLFDKTVDSDNTYLLPAGPYRESMQRLSSVDLVVEHSFERKGVEKVIAEHVMKADSYEMQLQPADPMLVNGGAQALTPQVHAVAGIGNPTRFFNTCRQLGLDIIEHSFPDHYHYQFVDIDFADELSVLMTEKDAVKCLQFADERHNYLPVSAVLNNAFDEEFLNLLKQAIKKYTHVN